MVVGLIIKGISTELLVNHITSTFSGYINPPVQLTNQLPPTGVKSTSYTSQPGSKLYTVGLNDVDYQHHNF